MLADWLGHVDNNVGAFVGGLVVTDEAACHKVLGLPSELADVDSDVEGFVAAMAAACRARFAADYGLAIGPFPKSDATIDAPARFTLPWPRPTRSRRRKSRLACTRRCCTFTARSRR